MKKIKLVYFYLLMILFIQYSCAQSYKKEIEVSFNELKEQVLFKYGNNYDVTIDSIEKLSLLKEMVVDTNIYAENHIVIHEFTVMKVALFYTSLINKKEGTYEVFDSNINISFDSSVELKRIQNFIQTSNIQFSDDMVANIFSGLFKFRKYLPYRKNWPKKVLEYYENDSALSKSDLIKISEEIIMIADSIENLKPYSDKSMITLKNSDKFLLILPTVKETKDYIFVYYDPFRSYSESNRRYNSSIFFVE